MQEIIVDGQQAALAIGQPRHLRLQAVEGKAAVCIGVRRCGKSTYLYQIMQRLRDAGVASENILYVNFFDDRLHPLQQQGPGAILEAYFSLYPEKKGVEKIYCFFDEIQSVLGWEPFVDRLLRTEKCEVYITGSSARMLSKEIATQMRGRALSWELFPFSFPEYLEYRGIDCGRPLSSKGRLLIEKAFGAYWESGGFPEVLDLDRALRIKVHQEYFHAILFRDLVERHDIAHPRAVLDLAHWLIDNSASLYSVNRLTGYLQSLGHKAPKTAVSDYLGWFEDAYFLFTVRLYDASLARANANPKKIYCIDHAMIESIASGILVNQGHRLENLVFVTLRRITPEIHYYRTRNGQEVDFIAQLPDRSLLLVQVCDSMADPETRKREVTALRNAMAERGLSSGLIITRSEKDRIEVDAGEIELLPAWRFLLRFGGLQP